MGSGRPQGRVCLLGEANLPRLPAECATEYGAGRFPLEGEFAVADHWPKAKTDFDILIEESPPILYVLNG